MKTLKRLFETPNSSVETNEAQNFQVFQLAELTAIAANQELRAEDTRMRDNVNAVIRNIELSLQHVVAGEVGLRGLVKIILENGLSADNPAAVSQLSVSGQALSNALEDSGTNTAFDRAAMQEHATTALTEMVRSPEITTAEKAQRLENLDHALRMQIAPKKILTAANEDEVNGMG